MQSNVGNVDFDVVIIGAGISGVNFAYRLQERCPNLSFTILEARHEIGGTWSLFKYPGIRSDSDLYTFGFPWRPWVQRTAIAEGPLIQDYLKSSASMYGIDKKIQFKTNVSSANWSSKDNTWSLDVTSNGTEQKTIRTHFLLMGTGYYDYNNALPAVIPGIEKFEGTVVHPQFWPEDLDYAGKDVVIIGSGATAITLLPSMAKTAAKVTMLQRSPSYVMSLPAEDVVNKLIRRSFTEVWQHRLIRWKYLFSSWLFVRICLNAPRFARNVVLRATKRQLPKTIPLDPNFTPSYNPFEQRLCLCPNADFYKSLRAGKANVVTGVIDTVTEKSIRLTNGQELHPDIIVTATGLKVRFGGGIQFTVDNKPFTVGDKFMWKGSMIEDLPNTAISLGYVDASWTLGADATAQLVCRLLNRMQAQKEVAVVPRRTSQEKASMPKQNLFRLSSTYLRAAQDDAPKAGDRGQWMRRHYYYKDILGAWFGDITSGLERIRVI